MPYHHPLLLRQLKRLGLNSGSQIPPKEQWLQLLDHISRAYTEADQGRYLLERSQDISSREMQGLYDRLEEAQRIAGLGNWSYDRQERSAQCSTECLRIFGLQPNASLPTYRDLSRRVHKYDRINFKDRVDAAFHDGKEFELEFRFILPSGEIRWLRAVGQPLTGAEGRVTRLHGTVMDVTGRKLFELRQSMEHTITRLLTESDSPVEVVPEIIQVMCETLGWVCGALWALDKSNGSMHRIAVWSVPDAQVERFYRASGDTLQPTRTSLLGRTLRSARPVWINDVLQDRNFLRTVFAREASLHASFAFPVQSSGELLGVVELFSQQVQKPDHDMLKSAHFIGRHIGQFFQRRQAEEALRESEAHFRALVEQASDSFYVHDTEGRFINVNQRGCDCLGYTREELMEMRVEDIDVDLVRGELRDLLGQQAGKQPIARESWYRCKDGSVFPVEIRTGPIEIDGHQHLLSLVRDVTERKLLQDHIKHLAYHDALTDLPNRAMFNRHLNEAIEHAKQNHKNLAVLFIDLDRFKNINDTLGHNAGDRLLQEMAVRLTSTMRDGDLVTHLGGTNDLVARLGGDEFVVLIEDVTDSSQISHVARNILDRLVEEYSLNGQLVHITASIGVSMFPDDGVDEFSLMKHADIAMYRAKERGKNNFQFYSAQMSLHSAELLALESDLRRALERKEFILHYQAKVEARTGRLTGVEALVRWNHPELGLLHPEHFIPLAEESGLIVPLSQWVLREACTQNCAWQEQGLPVFRMAINMSARQFADDNLLGDTANTLHEVGMDPSLLEIEITESMMMHNANRTIQVLTKFKTMGIRIAIDDFGIGYSSLSHLKQFPIDIIKIDRSFVQDIPGEEADEAIAEAIIAMGKSMKMTVVAEGVEIDTQLEFLCQRGCDEIQGYFFSRPIPADAFADLIWKNLATSSAYAN